MKLKRGQEEVAGKAVTPQTEEWTATHKQPSSEESNTFRWSIAIYEGESPFGMFPKRGVENPVLTYRHLSDVPASFVADPFMVWNNGVWYMFFEVLNAETGNGEIGLATSFDGLNWTYRQVVLREPYHLSYPYVFQANGQFYMVPETLMAGSIWLYKATLFPIKWVAMKGLVRGKFADPSLFYYEGLWWMFACPRPYHHDALHLYYARDLFGPWLEHSANPVIAGNRRIARPGGRVLILEDRVVRFTQDCYPQYGSAVRTFRVAKLTPTCYEEEELPVSPILVATGTGWNALGMHHIDPHLTEGGRWIACVDGLSD
jgi:hypothetical protein